MSTRTQVLAGVLMAGSWLVLENPTASGETGAASAGERIEIVDRAITFHGGDRFQDSEATFDLCSRSGCFSVRSKINGGLFEFEVGGPVRGVQRRVIASNSDLRLWLDGVPSPVSEDREQQLRDWVMARVYFVFLPFRLNDASVIKRDEGVSNWEGRQLHKITVTFVAGSSTDADDEFAFWFDPASGRLEQFAYSFRGRPGGIRFRRLFNYRRVGGILFYDQENWGLDGDGLEVESIDPGLVRSMERISTVTVSNVEVKTGV